MALSRASLPVRFSGGIETKMDAKSVPSTRLLALENGVFTKAISIVKRNGYEALSRAVHGSPVMPDGMVRLAQRDGELLAFTRDRCYSRSATAEKWADAGAVFSVVGRDEPAVRTGTDQQMPDHADARGVRVLAWEDSRGGVWWTTVDVASGRVYRAPEQLSAVAQRPRCLAVGDVLHIYIALPTLNRIDVAIVNPSTPTAPATMRVAIEDLSTTNPVYDAVTSPRADRAAIVAWAEDGTTNLRIGFVTSGGILGGPGIGLPSALTEPAGMRSDSPIGVSVFGEEIAVAWAGVGDTVALGLYGTNPAIVQVATTTALAMDSVIRLTLAHDADRRVWLAVEGSDDDLDPLTTDRVVRVVDGIDAAMSAPRELRGIGLASRAFVVDGDPFAVLVHDAVYFGVYLTYRLSDFLCVGRHLPGSASGYPTRSHLSTVAVEGELARVTLPYNETIESEDDDQFTEAGIRLISLDFNSEDSHGTAQLGRGLYLAGACPAHYDGRAWTEQGFHVGPDLVTAVASAGGALTPSRTYLYRAWYEWTDAQGEVHRGPTSVGTRIALGAGDNRVTVNLPTLRLTNKPNVRLCVGRSLANDESQLFRVTSLDPSSPQYLANSITVDRAVFVDTLSDDDLRKREPVYTNGGILPNDPAPLGSVIAVGKGRLFFSDASDPNVVRYSQQLEEGFAVEIAPRLRLPVDPFGGRVTGIAVMDEAVFVFKERAVFVFGGEGPLANGDTANGGFSTPQIIPGDVGCTDPNSIAFTPVGLVFKSEKGIHLVGRDRAVQYVGAPVEAFNAQAVRRATVIPERTQIVFLTDVGSTLLYDYLFGQWSTFTNHEGLDAAVIDGRYCYLRKDGRVFRETPGVYSDAGLPIRLRLETAWIHMVEHLQGWQRFYHLLLLGERRSAHQLRIQVRTDYGSHWSEPMWGDATNAQDPDGWIVGPRAGVVGLDPMGGSSYGEGAYGAGPYGGTEPQLYQWRVHLGLVAQAVQFRFEDVEAPGSHGPSFELTEMVITGGVKSNAKKPFSAARST